MRAARALSVDDSSLNFARALILLNDGAAGLQPVSELLNNVRVEGEPDPPLLAKPSLCVGFGLLGLEFDEPAENAVHSLLQWMLDRYKDFDAWLRRTVKTRLCIPSNISSIHVVVMAAQHKGKSNRARRSVTNHSHLPCRP